MCPHVEVFGHEDLTYEWNLDDHESMTNYLNCHENGINKEDITEVLQYVSGEWGECFPRICYQVLLCVTRYY